MPRYFPDTRRTDEEKDAIARLWWKNKRPADGREHQGYGQASPQESIQEWMRSGSFGERRGRRCYVVCCGVCFDNVKKAKDLIYARKRNDYDFSILIGVDQLILNTDVTVPTAILSRQ